MSNLIVSVIAITLSAILVLVGVFYGGAMFSSYQAEAQASRLISEAEQIAGTVSMYANEQGTLPERIDNLTEKEYFHEVPAKGVYTRWELDMGYAVNSIGKGEQIRKSCLSARKRWGFDAEAHCKNEAAAGCSPDTEAPPTGCDRNCLRTCYDPEDTSQWNPELSKDDPCCIDNSIKAIADPVFPSMK